MRVITWNVARRSSRLAEQAAALASREADLVALQEITDRTLPLWRAVLERIGLPHIRASLETADPSRVPRSRRRTGVLLGSAGALRDPSATLPVPWAETAVAAVAATAIGPVEIHCLHVPNAANGWVKPHTLRAVRAGLDGLAAAARGLRRPQHPPPRARERRGGVVRERFTGPPATGARQRVGRGRARRRPGSPRARLPGRLPFASRVRVPRAELDLAANLRSRRGWRLDHVFVSAELEPAACTYHHAWRHDGLSDHSALEADVISLP